MADLTVNEYHPEPLEDEPVWMRGFEMAMSMIVEVTLDASDEGVQSRAASALHVATGNCVLCGAPENVHEIKPRHRARQSIYLCTKDLNDVLRNASISFPGEAHPDEVVHHDLSDEMYHAGFRAGLLHALPLLDGRPVPDAPGDPVERAKNRRTRYYANLCSLCPCYAWRYRTTSQHGQLGVCRGCLDYLRDIRKLLDITNVAGSAARPHRRSNP